MMSRCSTNADESLIAIAQWLYWETRNLKEQGSLGHDELPTAPALAKALGLEVDMVKKRLQVLRQTGLVQVLDQNPKRYRIDLYALKKRTVGYLPPELEASRDAVLAALLGE
jgi:predicted ArsR family transcriptional regulator